MSSIPTIGALIDYIQGANSSLGHPYRSSLRPSDSGHSGSYLANVRVLTEEEVPRYRQTFSEIDREIRFDASDVNEARQTFTWSPQGQDAKMLLELDTDHLANIAKILYNRIAKSLGLDPILISQSDSRRYAESEALSEQRIQSTILSILVVASEIHRRQNDLNALDRIGWILDRIGGRSFIRFHYAYRDISDLVPEFREDDPDRASMERVAVGRRRTAKKEKGHIKRQSNVPASPQAR